MKKAFIFPGQGSQYVGMGLDFYESLKLVKDKYIIASEILGYDIAKISFYDQDNNLNETKYTQPAIFIHSAIINDILKEKQILPNAVAGHSLGEFSALYSANVLSFVDALKIIKVRANEMSKANKKNKGSMAAIIGANKQELSIICKQKNIVVPANINSQKQIVISGELSSIQNAINKAKELGIRKAVELNVSGAFHSPLMSSAREPLKNVINSVNFNDALVPIFQNINAQPIMKKNNIKANLIKQLENPVKWYDSIINIKNKGIKNFIEIGPNRVLSGLNRQIVPKCLTYNLDQLNDINSYAKL